MLSAVLFGFICLLLFAFIAFPWVAQFHRLAFSKLLVLSQLVGIAAVLSIDSAFVALGFGVAHCLIVDFGIGLVGWIVWWLRGWRGMATALPEVPTKWLVWAKGMVITGLVTFPATLYAWLDSTHLVKPGFAFRVGPDQFGWITAALQLCRGENLNRLTHQVQGQLGGTPLLESFNWPLASNSFTQISQIPSFTDQITAEFLIGANRTGIPGLLGSLCGLSQIDGMPAAFTGLAIWALLLTTSVAYLIARRWNVSPIVSAVISLTISVSASVLSVSLEGGYGQLVTLPFFLFFIGALAETKIRPRLVLLAMSLLIIVAASTYLDVVFLAGPFAILMVILRFAFREFRNVHFAVRDVLIALGVTLVGIIPALPHLWRLSIGPILRPTAGGWDQGRIPFPADIFGLASWLPKGNYIISPQTHTQLVVEYALSAVLLLTIILGGLRRNAVALVALILYTYLMWSVYSHPEALNNYRLWKYGEYAAVLLIFPLSNLLTRAPRWIASRSRIARYGLTSLSSLLALLLIVSSLWTSATWSADWHKSRKSQISLSAQETLTKLESKYDILVDAIDGIQYPTEYAMYGNAHYVLPTRGYGLLTHRSNPPRKLVVLRPHGMKCDAKCGHTLTGLDVVSMHRIATTNSFDAFLVTTRGVKSTGG